jgi:hypothetical protein
MFCSGSVQELFSSHVNILGFKCHSEILYVIVLIIYLITIVGKHKIDILVNEHKHHLLLDECKQRKICHYLLLEFSQTLVGILYILFITSNNIGFLCVTIIAHTLGSVWVLKTHACDSTDAIKALANSMRAKNISNRQQNDIRCIIDFIERHIKPSSRGPDKLKL